MRTMNNSVTVKFREDVVSQYQTEVKGEGRRSVLVVQEGQKKRRNWKIIDEREGNKQKTVLMEVKLKKS
jgi:hypothetical protein